MRQDSGLLNSNLAVRGWTENSLELETIAKSLRFRDVRELQDLWGLTPMEGLRISLESSLKTYIIYENEIPQGYFGLGRGTTFGVTHPWMLSSEVVSEYPILLCRYGRTIIKEWLFEFPILTNLIDSRNDLHISWLKSIGFKFIKDYFNFGPGKVTARQFVLCA